MARIYDALQAAQEQHDEQGAAPKARLPKNIRRAPAMFEKMLSIYQAIYLNLPGDQPNVVAFLGSKPGEGASTLLRAFGRFAVSEMGKRVLILDADHGFGRHGEAFNARPAIPCERALAQGRPMEEALIGLDNGQLHLAFLTPPELSMPAFVSSPAFREVFARLRERFDLILLDAPPAQESSDSLLLMPEIDGVIMVVEAEKTRWQVARIVSEKVAKQGGKVLGAVLNKRRMYIPRAIYRLL